MTSRLQPPTDGSPAESLRLLMINYEFPPLGGGSANATYHVLRELGRRGVQVDLVTSCAGRVLETAEFSPTIRLFRVPVNKAQLNYWTMSEIARWFVRAAGVLRRLVGQHDYDLCHCWSGWPSGVLGYLWRGRLPYLVALRGSDVPGYNPRLRWLDPLAFRPLSRVVWRSATAITCVSQSLAALAERTDPRIVPQVIGNGVDSVQFQPGEKPAQFTILYVGRLIPRKGVEFLIRAVADLQDAGGDCRLVLAGGGPERPALERFCRQRGIEGRVEFRGDVQHDDLPAIYARASLFVMPAVREAMSNAVLEAMASGLPVIMTRAGGSHCIDGNGLIVDSQDSAQLEAAIARYMNDADLVRRHGERSRALAERLTWPDVACAYLDLYRRTARARDERPRVVAGSSAAG